MLRVLVVIFIFVLAYAFITKFNDENYLMKLTDNFAGHITEIVPPPLVVDTDASRAQRPGSNTTEEAPEEDSIPANSIPADSGTVDESTPTQ